jgi:hypothetical protein
MQRLEVSGAVRHLNVSLGVKGLMIYLFTAIGLVTRWQWLFYMYRKYEIGY